MQGKIVITTGYISWIFNTDSVNNTTRNLIETSLGSGKNINNHSGAESIQNFRLAIKNRDKNISETLKEPTVKREISEFRSGVAKSESVEKLLSNPAVLKVLLRANGLGDQESYGALARRALMSDLADKRSLANRLTDPRWKNTAKIYEFSTKGLKILRDPKVLTTLEDAYAEITWRKSLDKATPGLSDALSFREQANSITSDLQILGDPILRRVVTTVLGLPLEIAFQSLETQQKSITSRLDIKRFQDKKFVENFTQRYLLSAAEKSTQDTISERKTSTAGTPSGLMV